MTAARTCAGCKHWSEYAAGLGECMEYVTRRQDAFAASDDTVAFHKAWPHKAAIDTAATHSCDRHEPERPDA